MSGVSMATVAAYAGVAGAVATVYSAYESNKQADKAYEAQLAQFRDGFRAATTNAEWARADADKTFSINQTYAQEMFDIGVETAWDSFFIEDAAAQKAAELEISLGNLATEAQLEKLVADAKVDITRINEQAQLDADYAVAMAKYSNDYTAIKTAMDMSAKASLTQQAVMFIDQDINTIKEQLNMAREALRAGKSDAIGKELLATATTLGMGASTTRRIMSTTNKADYLMQQKLVESDSAIDKAIASQKNAASQMGIEQMNMLNTAAAQIRRNNLETNEATRKIINSAAVSTQAIKDSLANAQTYATTMNEITAAGLRESYAINREKAQATITEQINTSTQTFAAETAKNTASLNATKEQSIRGELVSFSEEFSSTEVTQERAQAFYDFVTNNKDAVASVWADPTVAGAVNRDKLDSKLADKGLPTTQDIYA